MIAVELMQLKRPTFVGPVRLYVFMADFIVNI
jgi:hypothetical protein